MDYANRDFLLCRIICGYWDIELNGSTYKLVSPNNEQRYAAQKFANEVAYEGALAGLMSDDEVLGFLLSNKLWSREKEEKLEGLNKDIEELKVKLFSEKFRSQERYLARKLLKAGKDEVNLLTNERNAYKFYSYQGLAEYYKFYHIMVNCILDEYYNRVDDWKVIDYIIDYFSKNKLQETDYRELARTEPWSTTWQLGKGTQVFGKPVIDISDDQRMLMFWSRLYDNIMEHPDCPHDSIVEDDDMLDGWIIVQRRKRDAQRAKKEGEELLKNSKIRNAEEIFIVADSIEDAKKIDAMNDAVGKHLKMQKLGFLHKHGQVSEVDMPDSQQKMRMQISQEFNRKVLKK